MFLLVNPNLPVLAPVHEIVKEVQDNPIENPNQQPNQPQPEVLLPVRNLADQFERLNMAGQARCVDAPLWTANAFRKILRVSPLASNLSYSYMLHEDVTLRMEDQAGMNNNARLVDLMPVVAYKLYTSGIRITADAVRVGLMVEGFDRHAPEGCRLISNDVLPYYIRVLEWARTAEGAEALGFTMVEIARLFRRSLALQDDAVLADIDLQRLVKAQAMVILRDLQIQMSNTMNITMISLLSCTIISYSKRGSTTEPFLVRVANDIRANHGENVNLNNGIIRDFWAIVSGWIPENGAGALFQELAAMLPQNLSTRLALTIQHTAGSGLTAYRVIGCAIKFHPRFRWDYVRQIFPHEWANYLAAQADVAGDVYYGFRPNLGTARSTNFKNITFLCKEILIRCDAKASLAQYRGWPPAMGRQEEFMRLIENYQRVRNDAAPLDVDQCVLAVGDGGMDAVERATFDNEANNAMYTL